LDSRRVSAAELGGPGRGDHAGAGSRCGDAAERDRLRRVEIRRRDYPERRRCAGACRAARGKHRADARIRCTGHAARGVEVAGWSAALQNRRAPLVRAARDDRTGAPDDRRSRLESVSMSMTVEDIRRVVVIGAGTMGPGIAATFARHGYDTTLSDVDAKQIDKARMSVDFVFGIWSTAGFASDADIAVARKRLSFAVDADDAIERADFVLENAPERLEVKRAIFATLAKRTRETTLLASDTSGIPISSLQEGLANPGRVIGMHWSNPPHLIPVIEVVRGRETL